MLSWLRRCWTERVNYEGGLYLMWMDGLLLIPLMFAAFFYPLEALIAAGALLLVTFLIYEGCLFWRRHQKPRSTPETLSS